MNHLTKLFSPLVNTTCLMVGYTWAVVEDLWLRFTVLFFGARQSDRFMEGFMDGLHRQNKVFDENEEPLYSEGYEAGVLQTTKDLRGMVK